MNQQQVVELMRSSRNEEQWNANVDKVKAAFGGQYPNFWYEIVIKPNLQGESYLTVRSTPAQVEPSQVGDRNLNIYSRPTSYPFLQGKEVLIGVYDQGLGEKAMTCPTLEVMQELYDSYARGMAIRLTFKARKVS